MGGRWTVSNILERDDNRSWTELRRDGHGRAIVNDQKRNTYYNIGLKCILKINYKINEKILFIMPGKFGSRVLPLKNW